MKKWILYVAAMSFLLVGCQVETKQEVASEDKQIRPTMFDNYLKLKCIPGDMINVNVYYNDIFEEIEISVIPYDIIAEQLTNDFCKIYDIEFSIIDSSTNNPLIPARTFECDLTSLSQVDFAFSINDVDNQEFHDQIDKMINGEEYHLTYKVVVSPQTTELSEDELEAYRFTTYGTLYKD